MRYINLRFTLLYFTLIVVKMLQNYCLQQKYNITVISVVATYTRKVSRVKIIASAVNQPNLFSGVSSANRNIMSEFCVIDPNQKEIRLTALEVLKSTLN